MSRLDPVLNGSILNLPGQREPKLEPRFHQSRREGECIDEKRIDDTGLLTG
jgi:hypothetical protein